ncbi:hypothetical protein GF406_21820 [candidate division KSB1 bacterium]|nr:hypothetical protein [candidate division KSB1 bacterium]
MRKVLSILILAALIACTENPADPDGGITLGGTVQLEGSTQFTDTNVYLYTLPNTDSLVYEYMENYPVLGLDADPLVTFDHRQYEPAYNTTCNEEGDYRLEEVEEGVDYVLVVAKPNFGWQYHLLPAVAKGIEIPDLKLYPETRVQSLSGGYQIWEKDRHYIIENSVTLPASGVLFIDKGVTVRLEQNIVFEVNGKLECYGESDAYIRFTAERVQPGNYQGWQGLSLDTREETFLRYVFAGFARNAIKTVQSDVDIEHLFVRYASFNGILSSNSSVLNLRHSIFTDCLELARIDGGSETTIDKCLFVGDQNLNTETGVHINNSKATITNTILSRCQTGLNYEYEAVMDVNNCLMEKCDTGVYGLDSPDVKFQYNTMENLTLNMNLNGLLGHEYTFNNFLQTNSAHYLNIGGITDTDVIFQNCYWQDCSTLNEVMRKINQRILDLNYNENVYQIIIEPFSSSINKTGLEG